MHFLLFFSLINLVSSKIVILVLGSHVNEILNDRINTALFEANKFKEDEIIWYLSGGIKNTFDKICQNSEANKMRKLIDKENKNWKIFEDRRAKNTAENFSYFKKWLSNQSSDIKIFVSTSVEKKRFFPLHFFTISSRPGSNTGSFLKSSLFQSFIR